MYQVLLSLRFCVHILKEIKNIPTIKPGRAASTKIVTVAPDYIHIWVMLDSLVRVSG